LKVLTITRKYYFYKFLFSVSIIGTTLLLLNKTTVLKTSADFDTWYEVLSLLGTLLSLPVLIFALGSKINRKLGVVLGGLAGFFLFFVFLFSINKAVEVVEAVKNTLDPILGLFFVCSALLLSIKVWGDGK